jgi:hypothetical protein
MNIVDSSGWLEYFSDGPGAGHFTAPLSDRDNLLVPHNRIRVFKVILRERGSVVTAALLRQGVITIERRHITTGRPLEHSAQATHVRQRHFG